MTNEPDPLDVWVRRATESVPVPTNLRSRIERAHRRARWTHASAWAAAAIVFVLLAFLWPEKDNPVPEKPGEHPAKVKELSEPLYIVRLSDPPHSTIGVRDVQFMTEVDEDSDVLVFHFSDGGSHHD